jgi:uncharacterized protein (DUF433 family)
VRRGKFVGNGYDEGTGRDGGSIFGHRLMQCELIEKVPGKVSGRPVVRGTRVMPDPIVNSFELGDSIEEIHEGFPSLSVLQIERLINFAHAQRQLSQNHLS